MCFWLFWTPCIFITNHPISGLPRTETTPWNFSYRKHPKIIFHSTFRSFYYLLLRFCVNGYNFFTPRRSDATLFSRVVFPDRYPRKVHFSVMNEQTTDLVPEITAQHEEAGQQEQIAAHGIGH